MTEEEKKAVETVDKIIKRMEENEEYLRKQKNYLEGLLGDKVRKIIKLEEEIKELKENYIPKDKIRDKLDEIMSYTFTSIEERHQQNYAYDRIRELLEEE